MSSWNQYKVPQKRVFRSPLPNPVSFPSSSSSILPPPPLYHYRKEFAYQHTYESTLEKIKLFQENHNNDIITFIIPTINRNTLSNTLLSLLDQTFPNWRCIIIFDGCEPKDISLLSLLDNDKRFLYFSINRLGTEQAIHNSAGFVRNIGMNLVKTPWIGFVDDDDILLPNYIEKFMEEFTITPFCDVILFRMVQQNRIIPSYEQKNIVEGDVGISFVCKTSLIQEGYLFTQSIIEDFTFLKKLELAGKKIILSPYTTYLVRNSSPSSIYNNFIIPKRIIFN
jgi:glycosyltransferase involved in cell wall biosynthesis